VTDIAGLLESFVNLCRRCSHHFLGFFFLSPTEFALGKRVSVPRFCASPPSTVADWVQAPELPSLGVMEWQQKNHYGDWVRLPNSASKALEAALQRGQTKCTVTIRGVKREMDLVAMTQTSTRGALLARRSDATGLVTSEVSVVEFLPIALFASCRRLWCVLRDSWQTKSATHSTSAEGCGRHRRRLQQVRDITLHQPEPNFLTLTRHANMTIVFVCVVPSFLHTSCCDAALLQCARQFRHVQQLVRFTHCRSTANCSTREGVRFRGARRCCGTCRCVPGGASRCVPGGASRCISGSANHHSTCEVAMCHVHAGQPWIEHGVRGMPNRAASPDSPACCCFPLGSGATCPRR